MRQFLIIIISFNIILAECNYDIGDLNNDNLIDIIDIVSIINYITESDSNEYISIYDINGSLVESIFSGKLSKGIYNFSWSALRFSSGIYFIEVKTVNSIEYKKILLTK